MKAFAKILLKLAAGWFVIFIIYLAYYWWDMRQLRSFCDAIRVGTPVNALQQIADHHRISIRWLKGDGAFNERTNTWTYYVPSTASVGANVCAIHHDKVTVISAEIEID